MDVISKEILRTSGCCDVYSESMRPFIMLLWLHLFAEDHQVGCNGYRGRLKIIRVL